MDEPTTPQANPTPGASSEGYSKKIFSAKNIILYLVVAALAYGAIYYFFFAKDKTTDGTTAQDQVTEEGVPANQGPTPIIVDLTSQNNSGQDGVALLAEENGQVKVSISVSNPTPGTPQPAHIHTGKCPTPGDVKYPLSDIGDDGQSETTINATLASLKTGNFALNIHKSASDLKTYTSCGDLPTS